jgi:hypothetical protein
MSTNILIPQIVFIPPPDDGIEREDPRNKPQNQKKDTLKLNIPSRRSSFIQVVHLNGSGGDYLIQPLDEKILEAERRITEEKDLVKKKIAWINFGYKTKHHGT